MSALAEAVRRHWPAYVATFGERIPPAHVRAAQAILRCRTEEAGMVYFRCGECGRMEASPVSCGHRACNACGQHKAMEWEARQKSRLLPVPYHMVTFTLAIHYLVPGGALTDTGWVRPKNTDILVPAKPLAVRMRNRFRQALKAADFKLYLTIPQKAWQKPWNADTRPVGRGDTAFGYLARYVQKTALDAARIVTVTDDGVTIRWTERKSGESRTTMLTGDEFLRRFLQHVLPRGFRRVRHFGYLSAAARERYERLRALLRAGTGKLLLPDKIVRCCPGCGGSDLRFVCVLRPHRGRDPPPPAP